MEHKEKRKQEREAGVQRETLREKAARKLHGKGANPSQLGDPVSLKAETSQKPPTDGEAGPRGSEDTLVRGGSDSDNDKLEEYDSGSRRGSKL